MARWGPNSSDTPALAEEGSQVFAKLRFHGDHQAGLPGVAPTDRCVGWH